MSFTEALRYLDQHINLEARAGYFEDLSLNSMEKLMELSGDPHKAFRSIHITGTNGKGSTAHMISLILREPRFDHRAHRDRRRTHQSRGLR